MVSSIPNSFQTDLFDPLEPVSYGNEEVLHTPRTVVSPIDVV